MQRAEEVPYVLEILAAAAEGGAWDPARPFFSIVYCPVPPLQHEPEMLGAGLALARAGVPVCVYSMGLTGRRRRSRSPAPSCRPTPRS